MIHPSNSDRDDTCINDRAAGPAAEQAGDHCVSEPRGLNGYVSTFVAGVRSEFDGEVIVGQDPMVL